MNDSPWFFAKPMSFAKRIYGFGLMLLLCLSVCVVSAADDWTSDLPGPFALSQEPDQLSPPEVKKASYKKLFTIKPNFLSEISGAVQASGPDLAWWVLNDGGGQAALYRIQSDGQVTHQYILPGVRNYDWEDLAVFDWFSTRYLLIADTGDNDAIRSEVRLWIVKEPSLSALNQAGVGVQKRSQASANSGEFEEKVLAPKKLMANELRTVRLKYPDGARDVEAVSVDPQSSVVLFLSKRDTYPRLYALPVSDFMAPEPSILKKQPLKPKLLMEVTGLSQSFQVPILANLLGWMVMRPTALSTALLPDGKTTRYAILTYSYLYLFDRYPAQSFESVFAKPGQVLKLSVRGLPQAEAVALSPDGRQATVFSEGVGSQVFQWSLK